MRTAVLVVTLALVLAGCTPSPRYTRERQVDQGKQAASQPGTKPYTVEGRTYVPLQHAPIGKTYRGQASFYAEDFHGRKTATGETYDMYGLTAAHCTLPLNTWIEVRNLANQRTVIVRINDRGPFVPPRILDLSYGAARELHMLDSGVQEVEITVLR